jgi:23S rRNA pseudouridine2605 synthase
MEERLQKIMARAGLCSRRACEELISSGKVLVNGQVVSLGAKADPEKDTITVNGQPLTMPEPFTYIALYKPRGIVSAVTTPESRQTVRDLVPLPGRLYPVGRLDVDSEGLILLTNDGELANRLTHPRYGHEKEYRVLVAQHPDKEQLEAWRHGVVLEDGTQTQPAEVSVIEPMGKGAWLRVVLKEGRKRQIREMGKQTGLPVVRIIRTRIGSLRLGSLKPRQWRVLTAEEVAILKGQPVKSQHQPTKATIKLRQPRHLPKKSRQPGRPHRTSERGKHG